MTKKLKVLKFSQDFSKLKLPYFSTIRSKDKTIEALEVVKIISPSMEFEARCLG